MITDKELTISNQSYCKKDFYQIYPELLDLVTKITNRWNPSYTNESDPGVVLLKLLASVSDKSNYNIDKNVLECFMPSCAQEESMRKLCDMMGYSMKYYQSATTKVSFMYLGDHFDSNPSTPIVLPAFSTVVTTEDGDVNYTILETVTISRKGETISKTAIEGTICDASSGDSTTITIDSIDDNNRFYLPEQIIAENGIWVKLDDNTPWNLDNVWTKVSNLNSQLIDNEHKYCWKFGFDSKKRLPYIQFPDNISELIENGILIKYARTSGVNGNVSAGKLTVLSSPTTVTYGNIDISLENTSSNVVMSVTNVNASTNGADKETLNSAYNNFKRTIGTFNTLVTCRDYANAIYSTLDSTTNYPYVSNIQASDIRNNIYKSFSVVTQNASGVTSERVIKPVTSPEHKINCFDLYLHTFTPMNDNYTYSSYVNSFRPCSSYNDDITGVIQDNKDIAHDITFLSSKQDEKFCIKLYASVVATIITNTKVNIYEEASILYNIKTALYKNFNSREIEWGEEIPFDDIYYVIKNADTRIKNVILEEPIYTPKLLLSNGAEEDIGGATNTIATSWNENKGRKNYLDLLCKNILEGKVELFDYDKRFENKYNKKKLPAVFGTKSIIENVNKIVTSLEVVSKTSGGGVARTYDYTLGENEAIQFLAPNLMSTITYPAYVNYHWTGAAISADTDHKIGENESLKLNYTDSSDVEHWVEYLKGKIIKDGLETTVEEGVIIRPNFTLKDSNEVKSGGKISWAKVLDESTKQPEIWTIKGMFSLSTSEQIEKREFVKTVLTSSTLCYWLVNNVYVDDRGHNIGQISFDSNTYILNENEYFFYTDEAYSSLVILGPGTKLIKNKDDAQEYKIDYSENSINIEDIADRGIGAFANQVWNKMIYTNTTPFTLQEMQLINLVEGDTIKEIKFRDTANAKIDGILREVEGAKYILEGTDTTSELPKLEVSGIHWNVRSMLKLNSSSESSQCVKNFTSATATAAQKITLHYKEGAAGKTTELEQKTVAEKEVNPSFVSNLVLQSVGGTVNTLSDLTIEIFQESKPTYIEGTTTTPKELTVDDFTKIDFSKQDKVTLNILVPEGDSSLMTFYFNKNTGAEEGQGVKIVCNDKEESGAIGSYLWWYNEEASTSTTENSINLRKGLNTIEIKQSCTIVIQKYSDTATTTKSPGNVTMDIIKCFYKNDDYGGLNYVKLGLNKERIEGSGIKTEWEYILYNIKEILNDKDTTSETLRQGPFYYSTDIYGGNVIEADSLDMASSWFDYNNVFNKFVIAELDAGTTASSPFKKIKIAESSKYRS